MKVPVATNCWCKPRATEGLPGVTAIETRVAAVIVTAVLPLTVAPVTESEADAKIVELPVANAETLPLLTLATLAWAPPLTQFVKSSENCTS